MEKLNDMKHNQVADEELDQVAGGRNLFDVFTTEFIEFFNDPKDRDNLPGTAEENNFGISTLEMRIDPKQKRDSKDTRKVIKL